MSAMPTTTEVDADFDFAARVNELRCQDTAVLRRMVKEARIQQRRWKLEEMAELRVLDDRDSLAQVRDPAIDARSTKADLATARALETQPAIAAATYAGDLSLDQARPILQVATPETDAEWAARGRNLAPVDLQRMVRRRQQVNGDDVAARRAARMVTTWRDDAQGMGGGRWWLPDIDAVLVDKVLDHMAERMRPATGMPWDSLGHRKADALVDLCRSYADVEPTGRFKIEIVNILDPNAKATGAEIEGIALAQAQLNGLVSSAKVRDCEVGDTGLAKTVRAPRKALPADVERHVRRRDLHCRVDGCTDPVDEIHHLDPVSEFGDTTDVRKLAGVCKPDHRMLEPHGPYRLIGNPEDPGGLRLVHRDELLTDARAGP